MTSIAQSNKATWQATGNFKWFYEYRKHFAFFPVTCSDGTRLLWQTYYKQYQIWYSDRDRTDRVCNPEKDFPLFIKNITREDFTVIRLSETH